MYDYRRMTPQQRAEVVRARRDAGFPWHAPPHPRNVAGWFLITAACYEHRAIFAATGDLDELQAKILEALATARLPLGAWVFLPNHYHMLTRCDDLAVVGETLRLAHSRIATQVNGRHKQRGRRVWYRYSDRRIRGERHYLATVNYIHQNPVKHRWVDHAESWPWSSIHDMVEAQGAEWARRVREDYPIGEYGRGWDD